MPEVTDQSKGLNRGAQPNSNPKPRAEDRMPDGSKCEDQRSRDLNGQAPGDRGMCEKHTTTQGSE
ncbi:MAG: hypothetical protein ACXW32_14075 [Limisphaerales bacterium]